MNKETCSVGGHPENATAELEPMARRMGAFRALDLGLFVGSVRPG